MKIKIKNYKIIWQGQLKGKNRTLFVINPETDDVRLAVWGKTFPYAIGQEIEGEIREKPITKDGKTYINKFFIPKSYKESKPGINLFKLNNDFKVIKELLEKNLKMLESAKKELSQLTKVIYETEFEKQMEAYQSGREDDNSGVSEQDES